MLGVVLVAAVLTSASCPSSTQTLCVFSAQLLVPSVTLAFLHDLRPGVGSPMALLLSQKGLQSQTQACNRFDPAFDAVNHTVSLLKMKHSTNCYWAPNQHLSLACHLLSSVTLSNRIALSCSFATTQYPCAVPAQPFVQPLSKPLRQIDPAEKKIYILGKKPHIFRWIQLLPWPRSLIGYKSGDSRTAQGRRK